MKLYIRRFSGENGWYISRDNITYPMTKRSDCPYLWKDGKWHQCSFSKWDNLHEIYIFIASLWEDFLLMIDAVIVDK